jgi:hypothetical protein
MMEFLSEYVSTTSIAEPSSCLCTRDSGAAHPVITNKAKIYVQLVEVSKLKKEANNSIKLTLNLLNDGVPQNTLN